MNEIMIQYQGFHPTEFTRSFLDSMISDLYDQAPSGSTLRAVFRRKKKSLTAQVRIMSAAGQFFASATGIHLRDVSRKLTVRVQKQMKRWKTIRIQHQRLRDLSIPTQDSESATETATTWEEARGSTVA